MVAIVSGNSLGLSTTSLATLGQRGATGTATQGRSGEAAYVNVFNGNLVLRDVDQALAGVGLGAGMLRTYNSEGQYSGDGWSIGAPLKRLVLSGVWGAAGSSITRTDADGSSAVYAYDSSRGAYVSTDGDGAHDTIVQEGGQLLWKDGSSGLQERYEGSGAGRLLSQTDTLGNTVTYSYGSNGLLSRIADASGESLYLDYSGTRLTQLRSETLEGGVAHSTILVRYGYDSSGRLSSVSTDLSPDDNSIADGKVYSTTYTYDGSSQRIASVVQSDGSSLNFTYVLSGGQYKIENVTDGAGKTTHYDYALDGRSTAVTDPLGLVTRYDYDTKGQLTRITQPPVAGNSTVTRFTYDSSGNVTRVEGQGTAVDFEYDANGNQTLQRDAVGNTVTRSYSADNRLLTETVYLVPDADGAGAGQPGQPLTTRYVYETEASRRLRYILTAEGRVTEYRYSGNTPKPTSTLQYAASYPVSGLSATATVSLGNLNTWVGTLDNRQATRVDMDYDFRGQLSSSTTYAELDSSGAGVSGTQTVTHYVYDAQGRLLNTVALFDGSLHTNSLYYDGLGRVLTAIDMEGHVTLTTYDDAHNRTSVTSANGLITTSVYDGAGRLISVVRTDSAAHALGETRYVYDADGRLRMTEDATHVRHWMLYDAAGRQVADIDGNGSLVEYVYNADGQRIQTIAYATAVDVTQLVDAMGQPANVSLAAVRPVATARDSKSWALYDAAGRLSKNIDATGSVTEAKYDGASRVISVTQYANAIDVSSLGSTVTLAAATPAVSASDRTTRNFYDGDGKLVGTLDAEGYLTTYRYDGEGRQVETIRYATATLAAKRVSGTLAELLPAVTVQDIHSYNFYDARSQLIGTLDGEGYVTQNIYDEAGNLAQRIRYATRVTGTPGATFSSIVPGSSVGAQSQDWQYNTQHQVTSFTDVDGVQTTYTYDALGRVLSSTRAAGTVEARTTTTRYDLLGRVTGELSGEGSALLTGNETLAQLEALWNQYGTRYAYDTAGRRISSTDANGYTTLFYYDVDGNLTYTIDALGGVEERQYDTQGRLAVLTRYSASLSSLTGLTGGLVDTVVSTAVAGLANAAQDNRSTYSYNAKGLLTQSTDALGKVTQHAYDAFGDETQRIDPVDEARSLVTKYTYDKRGQLTDTLRDVGGLNVETSVEYDAFGRVWRSVDANHNESTQSYDRLGRVVVTRDPMHVERLTTYDAFSRVLTQVDTARNTTTQYAYDTAARSVTVISPEGVQVTTTQNRHGQIARVKDGNGNVTTYQYDRNGNLIETDTPLTQTQSHYDRTNRLIETIDANHNQVLYTYDAANRLLTRSVTMPGAASLVSSYGYDGQGRQIRVTDANLVVTLIDFDAKGQVKRQTVDPTGLNLVTKYDYDARGKTLLVTNPNNTQVQYVYDKLGRRTEEHTDPAGLNLTRQYVYDKAGNVILALDGLNNATRFVYDANGRLIYTVDALGGVTEQHYDSDGRVTRTTQYAQAISLAGLSNTTALSADEVERRLAPVLSSGLTNNRVYDQDGRLTWTVDAAGGVVHYTYDANGNVTATRAYANKVDRASWDGVSAPMVVADEMHDVRSSTFYDALNRMRFSIDGTGALVEQRYDGNGNVLERISYARLLPGSASRTLSGLSAASVALRDTQHDIYSRQTYDAAGRMTYRVDGVGAVTQFSYDANGNLTRQVAYATSIVAGAEPSSVSASVGQDRVTRLTYDKANRLSFQVDALGGVQRTVYDENGNVVARVAYDAAWSSSAQPSDDWLKGLFDGALKSAGTDRVTRYVYDKANRQIWSIDAEGSAINSRYDAQGRLTASVAVATQVASVSALPYRIVDTSVLPTYGSTSGVADRAQQYVYDELGRRTYSIDALGYVTHSQYDALGRVSSTTRFALASNQSGQLLLAGGTKPNLVTSPDDRTDTFQYDAAGRLASSEDALGKSEHYTYNGLGQKISFQNKKGDVWHYEYDAAGRLTQETAPRVQVTEVMTTSAGLIIDEGASGVYAPVTRIDYDALGNVIARTEAYGRAEARTTRYEYDAVGRQIKTIFPPVDVYDARSGQGQSGVTLYSEVTYDALGNAVANRDVAGHYSFKTYDLAGRVAYEIDAEGYVTGYTRSSFGEVKTLVRYATRTGLTDGEGYGRNLYSSAQVSGAINAAGIDHGNDRRLESRYDRLGRVTQTVQSASFVYDSGAAVGQQYGFAGATTRNTYNAFGELSRSEVLRNSEANSWVATSYYYDKAGHRNATIDAAGYLTEQFFDADGHVTTSVEYANKASGISLSGYTVPASSANDRRVLTHYDANGNKTVETRQGVEVSEAGSLITARQDLSTRYSYDALGNLTATTDAAGNATYSYYDAQGRVTAVQGPDGAVTGFRRDAYGNVVAQVQYAHLVGGGGLSIDLSDPLARFGQQNDADHVKLTRFDSHGHAVQTQDATGANSYAAYDSAGHLARQWQTVTNLDGASQQLFQEFHYDRLGQLIGSVSPVSTAAPMLSVSGGGYSSYETQGDYGPVLHETWNGASRVGLSWLELTDPSGGAVRVQVDYVTADTYRTWSAPDYEYGPPVEHSSGTSPFATQQVMDFSAQSAQHGVTIAWDDDKGLSSLTAVHVWQQAADGSWQLKWEGAAGQVSGQQAWLHGEVQEANVRYNAFGEVVAKGANGVDQEYFSYDNAGHLWKTNTGDGVDKVTLYDLQGRATASIGSDGITSLRGLSADQAAAMTQLRRTDKVYDLVGNVVQELLPQRSTYQGGVTLVSQLVQYYINVSAGEYDTEYGGRWVGGNSLSLSWPSLASLGGGDVRVVVEYLTGQMPVTMDDGYGHLILRPTHDEYGNLLPVYQPVTRTISQTVTADQAQSGLTLEWGEENDPNGGISQVQHLRVFKKDAVGNWQSVYDRTSFGLDGQAIEIAAPVNGAGTLRFQLRPTAGGEWSEQTLVNFGDAYRVSASNLPLGSYDYQVLSVAIDGKQNVIGNGSLVLTGAALASIDAGIGFGAVGNGVMSWQAQSADIQQTLRYRPVGSGAAWQSAPVTYRGGSLDGVDLSALGAGQYEYELLWTHAGEAHAFAHANGQFSVSQPVAPVAVGPVNQPVLSGVVLAYDLVGVADYGGSVGGIDYGGSVGGDYGGGVGRSSLVLEWPSTAATGGTAHFRYREAGGAMWQELPIDLSGHKVDVGGLSPATYEFEILITDGSGNVQSHATGNLNIYPQGAGHYETRSVPVQVPVSVTPADPSNYIVGWTGTGPTYSAPVVVGYDGNGAPIPGEHYAREVIGYEHDEYGASLYDRPIYSGRIVAVPYTVYHTEYQQQQVPVQVVLTLTKPDPSNYIVGWTGGAVYGAPAVIGYDNQGNPIPGEHYAREIAGYEHDEYGTTLYDHPVYSGRIVAVPYTAYRTEYQQQQVAVTVATTVVKPDPSNYIIGWTGGAVYGSPVVVGYNGSQPIYGQGYGMVNGQVVAIPYTVYHTEYQWQQVPVQVPTSTPVIIGYDYGQPVYAHDYGGNIIYQTDWHTEYQWQQVAVQVPQTIYPADPNNYKIADHSGSPIYGEPVRVVVGHEIIGWDYGTPIYGNAIYGYGQGYGEVNGQVVAIPYQETHIEYQWQQVPVQVAYTATPEDPAHFMISSHSGSPVYGEPVRVIVGYGDYGTPIYGYGQGYGEVNGQVVAIPYQEAHTEYQWQSVPVQVPTTVYPADPSNYITSDHSGNPVYGEPVRVVVGYGDYGSPIYGYGQGYGEVNGQVVAIPYTVWQTQYQEQQYWVEGTTPAPTQTDTTPAYVPGYVIPGVPSQFAADVRTAGGSTALSETGSVSAALGIGLNGGMQANRPAINRSYDRWGNVLSVSDARSSDWVTTFTYNANNQVTAQVQPTADGAVGGAVTRNYYDALGNQVAQRDVLNHVTAQTLDRNGRVIEEHHADGGVVYNFYDTFGNKISVVDAMGNATSYEYDKSGRVLKTRYAPVESYSVGTGSLVTTASYDQAGRLLMQTGTDGSMTRYDYDAAGNIVRTMVPGGAVTRAAYDAQGRKISEIDANGASASWQYDYFGRQLGRTDIGGAVYHFGYDVAGQLIEQTSTRGQNLRYAYDEAGQLKRIDNLELDQHTTYEYDLAGNHLREKTVQSGVVYQDNHLAYDALGRLRDVSDGRVHVSVEYDALGNRTHIKSHLLNGSDASVDKESWYAYDAMNRQILVDGAQNGDVNNLGNLNGTQGHRVTYDLNGNRTSDTSWGTVVSYHPSEVIGRNEYGEEIYSAASFSGSSGLVKTNYAYDAMNRLTVTSDAPTGSVLDRRTYDTGSRVVSSGNDGSISLDFLKARYGGDGLSGDGAQHINTRYDAAGRVSFQEVWNRDGTLAYDTHYNAYDGVGNVLSYTVVTGRGTSAETTNNYDTRLERLDGYKQVGSHLTSWTTDRRDGDSQIQLDAQGNAIGVTDTMQPSYNRSIVNDASGKALYVNQGGQIQRQLIVNGQVLGRYGQEVTGANDDGSARYGEVSDFNFTYQSIDVQTAQSGTTYAVKAGDTLQGIAEAIYGDGQLWYVIADANGLNSPSQIRVGQVLTVPARVGTIHNNTQTYKTYDPSKIQGDTSARLPAPSGDGGGGCGNLGAIIVAIVVVVVAVVTYQWYLAGPAAAGAGAAGAGAGAGAAGGTAAGSVSLGSVVAAGAVSGAAAATAGQLAAMAMGMQSSFDWGQVAMGAIGGAIGGAFSSLTATGNAMADAAVRAALTNATTQGVSIAVGVQKKFNWTAVAASAMGAGLGAALNDSMLGQLSENGQSRIVEPGSFAENFGKVFGGSARYVGGALSAIGAGLTTNALRGGKVDIALVAVDAFGNAVGSAIADSVFRGGQSEKLLATEFDQTVRPFVDSDNYDLRAQTGETPKTPALQQAYDALSQEAEKYGGFDKIPADSPVLKQAIDTANEGNSTIKSLATDGANSRGFNKPLLLAAEGDSWKDAARSWLREGAKDLAISGGVIAGMFQNIGDGVIGAGGLVKDLLLAQQYVLGLGDNAVNRALPGFEMKQEAFKNVQALGATIRDIASDPGRYLGDAIGTRVDKISTLLDTAQRTGDLNDWFFYGAAMGGVTMDVANVVMGAAGAARLATTGAKGLAGALRSRIDELAPDVRVNPLEAELSRGGSVRAPEVSKKSWTPPDNWQGPSLKKGAWVGEIGNSEFVLTEAAAKAAKVPVGTRINFVEGAPDFGPFTQKTPAGTSGSFSVEGLVYEHGADARTIVNQLAKEAGMSASQVRKWLAQNDLRMHHFQGDVIQLTPTPLHTTVHHTGSRGMNGL